MEEGVNLGFSEAKDEESKTFCGLQYFNPHTISASLI